MTILWAEQALTQNGWEQAVRIDIDKAGRIASVTPNQPASGHRMALALPAIGNLHSHGFQRAMAGLTEKRGADASDSFWSWRKLMYDFLEVLTPNDVEAVTAFAQMEMLESGFGSVAEFHYLHHGPFGQRYSNVAELSERIFSAQNSTGIGLTNLPVYYAQGGCDGRPLAGGQLRFGNDFSSYQAIVDGNISLLSAAPADCGIGIAPHSLRAVEKEALDDLHRLYPSGPVHLHIAEQQAEVTEVLAYFGARPVEWLLSIQPVDARWCLVHATQMTPQETLGLAKSGAVAGLCPITESNLGDGIFDGENYLPNGGVFGLGSDSNIRISLTEEMRTLEYSQRLKDRNRAAIATPSASVGRTIFEGAAMGGAQALGRACGSIAVGNWADILEISTNHPDMEGLKGDTLLDAWIFARDDRLVRNVWSAGRHMVQDGRHINTEAIIAAYRNSVQKLRTRL
ncbi:MAG: formimidoylglutamate deiminase [Rhodobacterales bacterium]